MRVQALACQETARGRFPRPDLLSLARLSTGKGTVIVLGPGKTTEPAAWAGAARGRDGLPVAKRSC